MRVCTSCGEENPDRARFCLACAAPLGAAAPERRKLATLLFCDLSGSTAMGERVDAESVRDLMFRYFHEMRSAIERHGGTVEKFVGDAVMAVFGVPTAHEDDALRAVRAAAEMRERLERLNEDLERRFGVRLALRIGVNTGEVVAGDVSTRETLVTGDAVNVAARLEQAAGTNEILLGELTLRLCRGAVEADAAEPLALKGKGQRVPAYRLRAVAPSVAVDGRRASPLVARRAELAALESSFTEATHTRRCVPVTVVGEPGIGKSRLVAEFVATLADRARLVRGRCLSYGEGITFFPLAEIVRDVAGVHDEHDPDEALARIRSVLAAAPDGDAVAGHLAAATGVADAPTSSAEIAWAVRRLLEALTADRPLVAIVEDVHWAEPALLDLLQDVATRAAAPVLLLCTARPELRESRPEWPVTLSLQPLDADDVALLIDEALERTSVPRIVTRRIVEAAGGNPLFVEELLAMLIEDGLLRRDNGSWLPTTDLSVLAIPPTISALLADRLDRLPEVERAAAERGSIEGEVFHRGAVQALSPDGDRAGVTATLRALADRDLIRPAVASFADDAAYRFKHALIRDSAYGGLPKKVRAELHERFAGWLEQVTEERAGEYDEFLGYHLEQAYRYRSELGPVAESALATGRRAADALIRAGRRAAARGDASAAGKLLGRAAALLAPDDRERIALLPEVAEELFHMGDFVRGRATVDEALERSRALGDRRLEARAALVAVVVRSFEDPNVQDEELRRPTERAVDALTEAGDTVGLARAWRIVAYVELMAAQGRAMMAAIERSLDFAQQAGDRREEMETLFLLPMLTYFGPLPRTEGVRRCRDVLERSAGARKVEAFALQALGILHGLEGSFDEARGLMDAGLAKVEDLGAELWTDTQQRGELELLAGDDVAAERFLRASCERLRALGETSILSTSVALLAEALYRQMRYDEAYDATVESEENAAPADLISQAEWRSVRAKVLAQRGDGETATRLALDAVDRIDRSDFIHRATVRVDLAEVYRLLGRHDRARIALTEALTLFEQKEDVVSAARARAELARLDLVSA